MKLKKLTQILIIGCGILALGACSSTRHKTNDDVNTAAMNDMNNSNVRTSGLGENERFGDQGGVGGHSGKLAKRTYYFDFDKYDVRDTDKSAILANADWLAAHPNSKVILEGHTDPRGSREYNVGLGENRAKSVLDILQSRGVNPSQIHIVSYGSERPAAQGRSEQDFQLDRRAIIDLAQR